MHYVCDGVRASAIFPCATVEKRSTFGMSPLTNASNELVPQSFFSPSISLSHQAIWAAREALSDACFKSRPASERLVDIELKNDDIKRLQTDESNACD